MQVCNCDCLPIIPLDLAGCHTCAAEADRLAEQAGITLPHIPPAPHVQPPCCSRQPHHAYDQLCCRQEEDEAMSDGGSRDSLDSVRSDQSVHMTAAAALAAVAVPPALV